MVAMKAMRATKAGAVAGVVKDKPMKAKAAVVFVKGKAMKTMAAKAKAAAVLVKGKAMKAMAAKAKDDCCGCCEDCGDIIWLLECQKRNQPGSQPASQPVMQPEVPLPREILCGRCGEKLLGQRRVSLICPGCCIVWSLRADLGR